MIKLCTSKIIKNEKITANIFDMTIEMPGIVNSAKAGQFINLYTDLSNLLLPRPISICSIDKSEGTIRIVYQKVGKGTEYFSSLQPGQNIKVMGALGNGFNVPETKGVHIAIGGGMGTPPLIELVKSLQGEVIVFLGFRTGSILADEFIKMGAKVYIATEDGSKGFTGNVIELIKHINPKVDFVYSCGPATMLCHVSKWAEEKDIKAQISMEARMGCGFGACVGCTVKVKKAKSTDWENQRVCKDGPVFLSDEVMR